MYQILLALHKHMSNLPLQGLQMQFESNVILMDRLFIIQELLQENITSGLFDRKENE